MKKRKSLKRAIAFFMAVLMILTMIPKGASASEIVKVFSNEGNGVVTYTNDQGKVVTIHSGDTLNVSTTENGKFTCENYSSGSTEIEWRTSWEGESQKKPVWIGLISGDIAIFNPGSVSAEVTKAGTGEVLCSFTIVAEVPKVEEIKLYIDDKEVTNDTYTVAGHQWKNIKIKGKYSGTNEFVDFSNTNGFSMTADKEFIACETYNGAKFAFEQPGTGVITVDAYGAKASFTSTSTYVPIESVKLNLRPEVKMHRLQYSMGSGDNYIGVGQTELNEGLTITPSNSSNYTVEWKGNNDKVASYYNTHNNGFIGHDNGSVTITASVADNGEKVSASCDVNFVFEKLVEGISMKDGQNTFNIKEEEYIELPLVYEPNGDTAGEQPSQTAMKWSFSKDDIVKIKQSRGEYDNYSSRTFVMTALTQGTVEVIGTPLAAKEGVEPVKFTVTVEEGTAEPPDTDYLVSKGISACKSYYSYEWKHDKWQYTDEWNILALKRSGLSLDKKNEAAAIDSYKSSIASNIADGTLAKGTKPTTLARVALALESIGVDAASFEGFNFYEALLNSNSINTGSNESIWALIALDAKKTPVPENTKYNRDNLIETIISFQTKDGGFNLGKSEKGGDIDLTAMAIQALSPYQDKSNAKDSTEKALDFLRNSMEISCDMNGTSESIAQTIIGVSSLERDIADKANGFTSGRSKNIFVALDKYRSYFGFKHKKEDSDVNHMSTQQALLALTSYSRVKNHQNTIYDMTDIASENYELPVINVQGVENNQLVSKKGLTVQIGGIYGKEKIENLKVWLNGEEQQGEDGSYTFNLNKGNNSLNIKAISKSGAVAQLQWTIKFSALDYKNEINKSIEKMNTWAKKSIREEDYTLSQNALIMTYMRTVGSDQKVANKVLEKAKEEINFNNVQEWTNMILVLHAMGVDVNDVYGVDFWKSGNSFLTSLSVQDSVKVLIALNAKYGQNVPEEISRENLLKKIVANADGGFGADEKSNVYDTASAVIALSGENDRQKEVEEAVEWLANHQTSTGGFNETGSYSELNCIAKVMEALCTVGIDFTLDDRFNNTENIYTKLKALLAESEEKQNEDVYRALAVYQRLYNGKSSIYSMDDIILQPGLTEDIKVMEDTVATYLKTMDFSTYSPEATEAAYLLIRGNQATVAVYNYLDVLKVAVKENKITTAREYFFAGLYLKENKISLSDVDGTDMLSQMDKKLDYTTIDSFGNLKNNATIPMSYALMTLNLQPDYETDLRADLISKIVANRVPQSSWSAKGFYVYSGNSYTPIKQEATIAAMMALKGSDELNDIESLIDYLGGKGTYSYDERQLDSGYWADYRKDSNKLVGNLVTTADMITGIQMFDVNLLTDVRFQKENGNVENGIRTFYRMGGFADTPEEIEVNKEATIGGYRALLALRFAENNLPSVYDVEAERQIDKTALDNKIKEAEALQKEDYTKETWEVLEKALEQAKTATTQKEINLALEVVTNAIDGLKEFNEINVTFRLIGDWNHEDAENHTSYVNWIKTRAYTVSKDAKVYDVFVKALEDAGLKSKGADSNYVSTIQAPEAFGSYMLSEMSNGSKSGWKYMVNGQYPSVGLKECKLSDGDVIIWRYIDDYTDEKDDNELWKEAEDLDPTEIFANILAKSKTELQKYVDIENYEEEQQKAIESTLKEAMKQLDEAKDTVAVESIISETRKALDEVPTMDEVKAERELAQAKEKAKETLASYKDTSLYQDKEKEELKKILEDVFGRIDESKSTEDVEKIVIDAKAAMDDVKTAEQIINEEEQVAINKVIEAIDKIKNPVTVDQKVIIEEARKAYDALTKDQKDKVTNYEILTKAEEELKKLLNSSEPTNPDEETGDKVINSTVKTGDGTEIVFMAFVLLLSVGGIYLIESSKRRNKMKQL